MQRKHKFLIHSILMGVAVALFSLLDFDQRKILIFLSVFLVLVGTFVTHFPNINTNNYFMNLLLPIHLVLGAILSLIFFPNLALPVKIIGFVVFAVLFYTVSLINNVFLVVEDRSETIPLYRVAATWGQIILVIVAIPYFAGIFKLPINSLYQNTIVAFSSLLFSLYLIWTFRFDKDVKVIAKGEKWLLCFFTFFCVWIFGMAVSFLPSESFLRALFVASVLMFNLSYLQNHFKNTITQKVVSEYIIISILFLSFLLVFTP